MSSNSQQRLSSSGKPLIGRTSKLPQYSTPVEYRIKNVKAQLNQGLSKFDSAWNNITRDISNITV